MFDTIEKLADHLEQLLGMEAEISPLNSEDGIIIMKNKGRPIIKYGVGLATKGWRVTSCALHNVCGRDIVMSHEECIGPRMALTNNYIG